MATKKRNTTTITINVPPEFKATIQRLADVNSEGSITTEVMDRLNFTLRWATHIPVQALSDAMEAFASGTHAQIAIASEQSARIQNGTYGCAQFRDISPMYPLGLRKERTSLEVSSGGGYGNALANINIGPMGRIELSNIAGLQVDALAYETSLGLNEDEVEVLVLASTSREGEIGFLSILERLSEEWFKKLGELPNDEGSELLAKRNLGRLMREARTLFMAGETLIDLFVFDSHEAAGYVAASKLHESSLGLNGVFSDEALALVPELVDYIDEITTKIIQGVKPIHDKIAAVGVAYFEHLRTPTTGD